ncbi:hypothetical protein swp_1059 [Shewanella piezotolerans WP3]|uniref:Uncharacterized protein n=1 Tax=Shewanella piezotolerans (strain WP3 / JCM 13877) TaxID=225849 RepID=B8CJ99_SHEPW|nr:hypothetical protein swp_1059 [Shewanella piezotolerans WP3]
MLQANVLNFIERDFVDFLENDTVLNIKLVSINLESKFEPLQHAVTKD